MEARHSIIENLQKIRDVIDSDVTGCDIVSVQDKMLNLTQLSGLSAESLASATALLKQSELIALNKIKDDGYPASIMSKMIDAECADQIALVKYADRINAAITHTIDGLRSVISLYKEELSNNLKQ